MDIINQLALEVFNCKESYTTNDYLVIMNILKEQYHRLNGDFDTCDSVHKLNKCESVHCSYDVYEDGLCFNCFNLRSQTEDIDYSDSYIESY